MFCSVLLFALCSCLEEPRWLFLCSAAICCFCCVKVELLCDIFAWFVRSSGLLYFSQPEETIPILQGMLERTWDMNKDSKLPMKLVFPFCILILPLTKSFLIVLQESWFRSILHNCLNFYISRHLYVNYGCHSRLKSQMRIIRLVAQIYKHGKWCCTLWWWVL